MFYTALAHHVKGIDLHELHSSLGALENYIGTYPEEVGTYEVILSSLWELGQFDDIVAASPSKSTPAGDVALYFSTATDAWGDNDAFVSVIHVTLLLLLYLKVFQQLIDLDLTCGLLTAR